MRLPRAAVGAYGLLWLLALLGFGLLTWWSVRAVHLGPALPPVLPEQVRTTAFSDSPVPEQTIKQRAEPLKLSVSGADFTLSSSDGTLKMRVWADKAAKSGGTYDLTEGALEFVLKNHDTLLLRVTDGTFRVESGVAQVSGTLIGHLVSGGQYFSAERVRWDLSSSVVQAERVRYTGPNIEVRGEQMNLDLTTGTGKVEFTGPVEAGI
jgi:hypothetical protein